MMGSYCHCQQVVTFFFFGLHLTTWVKGPTLTLCPGPLNFSGRPCWDAYGHTLLPEIPFKTCKHYILYIAVHCSYASVPQHNS